MIEACNPPRFSVLIMGHEFFVPISQVTHDRPDMILTRKSALGIDVLIVPGGGKVPAQTAVEFGQWTPRAIVHVRADSHGVWPADIEMMQ